MSIETLLAAARAAADPLALLFLAGSLGMLWGLWKVLVTDIDLSDDDERQREDEKPGSAKRPPGVVGGGKA